jgi:peroxiredoxin Q/BCP
MADSTSIPKAGSLAPEFTLPARSGLTISLRRFRGSKRVLVYFYPKDDTPGCTKEACSLRDGWSELMRRGVEVLGISRDDAASHNAFAAKYDLPFELLTDADHRVHEAYGAWGESAWGVGPLRKSFLIGKDGRILHVFEKVDTEHHAEEVLKAMESSVPPGGSQPPPFEPKPAAPAPAPTMSEAVEKAAQAVQTAMTVATQDAKRAVEKAAGAVAEKAATVKMGAGKVAERVAQKAASVKKAARKAAKKVARRVAPRKKKAAPKKKAARKAARRPAKKTAKRSAKRTAKRATRKKVATKKVARKKSAPKRKAAKRKKR